MYFTPGWGVIATATVGLVGVAGTLTGTALALRQGRWLYRQQGTEARRIEQRESILELLEVAARLRPEIMAFASAVENADLSPGSDLSSMESAQQSAIEQANKVLINYRRSSLIVVNPEIIAALDEFLKQFEILKRTRNQVIQSVRNGEKDGTHALRTNQQIFDDASRALLRTALDSLQAIKVKESPTPPHQTTRTDSD